MCRFQLSFQRFQIRAHLGDEQVEEACARGLALSFDDALDLARE